MDVKWSVLDNNYIVRNVPYEKLDVEGDNMMDAHGILERLMEHFGYRDEWEKYIENTKEEE